MSDQTITGGCACGKTRYQVTGSPIVSAYCHCQACRRASSAPVVA